MSKEKKKGKGGLIAVLILLIAAILVLLYFFGGNFGLGAGNGGVIPAIGSVANTESETTPEETPEEISYIDVTVNGDEYLYENSVVGLDQLIEKIKGFESPCEVHINVSETATLDAVDALKAALDADGINYSVIEP